MSRMTTGSHVSPSSSPRLPSPPPMAEDKISSPQIGLPDEHGRRRTSPNVDQDASRRIRPGTKAIDMTEGPPLMNLTDIDSAFQLTEHLKALHHYYTHPENSTYIVPVDHEMALQLAQPPEAIDRSLWLYELCRFLVQKVNTIITALFADQPPCSSLTCPEMRASEWQYLCAVHDPPKSCCAIDYCCHTLDWAANILSSPKHFPSRLALGTEATNVQHQERQLTNIFRRVYRIFAHAWFQHREIFWRVEGKSGLYMFFKTVCDAYSLIPQDSYTIPPEAEGKEAVEKASNSPHLAPSILMRAENGENDARNDATSSSPQIPGATTRRHRQSPSSGAHSVGTVIEENEDEEDIEGEDLISESKSEDIVAQSSQQTQNGGVGDPVLSNQDIISHGSDHDNVLESEDETIAGGDSELESTQGGLQRADTARRDPVQTDDNKSTETESNRAEGLTTEEEKAAPAVGD